MKSIKILYFSWTGSKTAFASVLDPDCGRVMFLTQYLVFSGQQDVWDLAEWLLKSQNQSDV